MVDPRSFPRVSSFSASFVFGVVFVASSSALAQVTHSTSRVSLGTGGVEGDLESHNGALSHDARYVAFQSLASNFGGASIGQYDVYVRDLTTGQTAVISTGVGGAPSDSSSCCPGWSSDGRWISFASDATNLVVGDTNLTIDVFVFDRVTGVTTRESIAWNGAEGDAMSAVGGVSADGRYVLFESDATNLVPNDTNGLTDVFLRDRLALTTERVSVGTAGQQGNGIASVDWPFGISADGHKVAFTSDSDNLVPGDNNGTFDVFVRDLVTGTLTCETMASAGVFGNSFSVGGDLSSDGRFLVFTSDSSNLLPGDTNGLMDVFRRDLQTGALLRLSVGAGGAELDGISYGPRVSADGMRVSFTSHATNLVVGDVNGVSDVFVHDVTSGTTSLVSQSNAGAFANQYCDVARISADGRYVVFDSTATNLVGGDTNGFADVFLVDTAAPLPSSYCTAKTNSQGCTPAISFTGYPSLDDTTPFAIRASNVLNKKSGLLLYGPAAQTVPFQGGWLCVAPPIHRAGAQLSGGNPPPADCSGHFSVDFNAHMRSKGYPEFQAGSPVYAQYWYRDPGDPFKSALTDALTFVPAP